jgi:putative ATPase
MNSSLYSPLADRLRPVSLEEVVGQKHLIGRDMPFYNIIKSGILPNMIFYGPSGIGKTTIANILASSTKKRLHKLNATSASTGDIKAIVDEIDTLLSPNGILLYLDEIQYFNKKQQQLLLQYIESGKITLIASTTENPYFYIYNAILSRCTVFEFKPISSDDIKSVVIRAIEKRQEESGYKISIDEDALKLLSFGVGGDVRKAINCIEVLTLSIYKDITITTEMVSGIAKSSSMRYDRDGDVHYDLLSAFQKSIRGSDENAAIHYLARLIAAGDLISICRRLLVIASEDISLAYPMALPIVKSLVDSANQLGFPEARIPLANATILLATAPKSNSAITAIDKALFDVENGNFGDIPSHLKDSHYAGAEKLGKGINYIYPHGFKNNYIKQQYLPDEIINVKYYEYSNNKIEQATKLYWEKIKSEQK